MILIVIIKRSRSNKQVYKTSAAILQLYSCDRACSNRRDFPFQISKIFHDNGDRNFFFLQSKVLWFASIVTWDSFCEIVPFILSQFNASSCVSFSLPIQYYHCCCWLLRLSFLLHYYQYVIIITFLTLNHFHQIQNLWLSNISHKKNFKTSYL